MEVRTRIAPSPTGFPHIGTIYQMMYDYVFAKKYSGKFVFRLEDTDQNRLVEGAEQSLYQAAEWFGLTPDEGPIFGGQYGPYRSSERLDIYQKHAQILLEKGFAYYCFCSKERLAELRKSQERARQAPKYDKKCLNLSKEEIAKNLAANLSKVIRLNVPPDQKIVVYDAIVGDVEFDSNLIDDQVLLKSDGYPTYHLAVVVDDYLMKVSHVFRGTEWLPSTPKHILLYQYFGWNSSIPKFIHVPLLLDASGPGKLSKRMGHASVEFYQKEGFLPEAILNYLSNIVWNHPEGKEIYDLMEFGKAFELEPLKINIKPGGAKFDLKKLEWINGEYIRKMSDQELTKRLQDYLVDHPAKDKIAPIVPLIKERIKKLSDFIPLTDFFFAEVEYEKDLFNKILGEQASQLKKILIQIVKVMETLDRPWQEKQFEQSFRKLAAELDLSAGQIFQLIRLAVSGQLVTPPLFESIKIIGEDETLNRIKTLVSSSDLIP